MRGDKIVFMWFLFPIKEVTGTRLQVESSWRTGIGTLFSGLYTDLQSRNEEEENF